MIIYTGERLYKAQAECVYYCSKATYNIILMAIIETAPLNEPDTVPIHEETEVPEIVRWGSADIVGLLIAHLELQKILIEEGTTPPDRRFSFKDTDGATYQNLKLIDLPVHKNGSTKHTAVFEEGVSVEIDDVYGISYVPREQN
jgi:hypothetical protein